MVIANLQNDLSLELVRILFDLQLDSINIDMVLTPTLGTVVQNQADKHKPWQLSFFRGESPETTDVVLDTVMDYSPTQVIDWLKAEYARYVTDVENRALFDSQLQFLFAYVMEVGTK